MYVKYQIIASMWYETNTASPHFKYRFVHLPEKKKNLYSYDCFCLAQIAYCA